MAKIGDGKKSGYEYQPPNVHDRHCGCYSSDTCDDDGSIAISILAQGCQFIPMVIAGVRPQHVTKVNAIPPICAFHGRVRRMECGRRRDRWRASDHSRP